MGVAPSRETIRRGFFNVSQANPSASGSGSGKRQDIILIPLTKEYFPSPDCPLFVQFHKARCDAAVNYYFRRPGNPGDLSCIPNYASSYRLPGEETRVQRRRRRQEEREARAAAAAAAAGPVAEAGLQSDLHADGLMREGDRSSSEDDDGSEDDSYPSREALYRGVIEHVEEMLFDTDAEMRHAYEWALAHPRTTMGPDGKKQRKVLPVLCAVAFRSDISKVLNLHNALPGGAATRSSIPLPSAAPPTPSYSAGNASVAGSNMQAALENGVYMFGSIINIVGCFGFASMQEDVDDARRASTQAPAIANQATSLLTPGSMQATPLTAGGTYHNDPYSFTSSQASSGSAKAASSMNSSGTLLRARGTSKNGCRYLARIAVSEDMMTLPPPVAAPLAAMVFLTKSAGEQNLGRVTYIAASTYYYQMIQAGLIERQPGVRMEGPITYPSPTASVGPSLPPYDNGADKAASLPAADALPPMYGAAGGGGTTSSPVAPLLPSTAAQGPPRPFLPPMETFSFSSLLTNIPILSFLYEMKWRWGYLGVLKGGTPTAGTSRNSSFSGGLPGHHMDITTARGPGSMMGNHSTGGLAAIDRSVGQGVTDEMEMWITADQMIHGRISKDLAQRLCWSLAERPEVMQERVTQLPSEESGYWRYRGLVDQAHPPPTPEPGRVVTIHPKDVYVMGSDVLPGFNEGDILRFDPGHMVWFADHSIPLEGVVLAAMRPYCKQAREADSDDPAWVTRVCDRDEAEALHGSEGDGWYPPPRANPEQLMHLQLNPGTVHIHEHVGNFYVYRFERDGSTYYHGTVPNFANPNKKKQPVAGSSPGASASGTHCSHHPSPSTAPLATFPCASSAARPPLVSPASAPATSASKPASVPVPKTIASALFSLLPASRTTTRESSTGTVDASGSAVARSGAGEHGSQAFSQTGAAPGVGNTPAAPAARYLATPVISSASSEAMSTARRWVQALYSYAYGAPNMQTTRRGPSAASPAVSAAGPSRPPVMCGVAMPGAASANHNNGSYPSTPAHVSRGMTPTSMSGSAGFPNALALDVAVWPPQRLMPSVATPQLSPVAGAVPLGTPSAPTMPGGSSPAVVRHSRSSSRTQMPHTGAPASKEDSPAAPPGGITSITATSASKPIKRYVEGGSYEWDWRTQ
ncbi:hypothetical protein LSCM1_01456 [Leishmania martiniquensis]|uniref:Uncharacterized protein n=1 Tax=Leishmania martiniquensis TaxID=1580590 RepID=A0A836FXY4_9TRYP|nr:hypothetical protein LSCM1_01456 [Leishmania martiniquensis]